MDGSSPVPPPRGAPRRVPSPGPRRAGSAPRDVRRRLDQFAANPACEANVISAAHGVPMKDVARLLGIEPKVGQSPFAIQRGQRFERSLFEDDAERLRAALIAAGALPEGEMGFLDLRLRSQGGPCRDLEEALRAFEVFLRRLATAADPEERAALPRLVAGPVLAIPGRAILPDGRFALDAILVELPAPPAPVVLRVVEIKVYPDRGGHTDARQLAATRAQAGVYVHALELAVRALGLASALEVSTDGVLVLTKGGGSWPSVRPREDLRWQAARAERVLERLREAAEMPLPEPEEATGALDGDAALRRLAVVRDAPKRYDEGCLAFCELAEHCHASALDEGRACALGRDVARFVGGLDLHRAAALMDGAPPETPAEEDFVRRLEEIPLP